MRGKAAAIAAVAFLVLAFLLNPSPERHREKIREAVAERSPIAGLLGVGAVTAFASGYYSLGIASYTRFDNRLTSIGFMGLVFVP